MLILCPFTGEEDKDHHEETSEKKHEHGLNSDAEEMIKNVKSAMERGEGCRVLCLQCFFCSIQIRTSITLKFLFAYRCMGY